MFYIILLFITTYQIEYKQKTNLIIRSEASKELNKTEQLLMQLMPPHVLRNLEEEKSVTDRMSNVTLLYADIVGFTAWSSIREPQEVVGMLSELFTRFDKMCLEFNVYKVHTIGDCYVAMSYIDYINRNPAKEAVNMIKFANSLIKVIEETNLKCGCELGMRIGIHTGDVIAGITGTKLVRYDIYGPDALIANKMESNGEKGKVALSETTKILLEEYIPGAFEFAFHKEINVLELARKVRIYIASQTLNMLMSFS